MRDCTRSGLVLLLLLCLISGLNGAEPLKAKKPKAGHADTSKKTPAEESQQNKASQTNNFKKVKPNEDAPDVYFDETGRIKLPDGWVDPLDMMEFDLTKPKPKPNPEKKVSAPDEDPQPELSQTTEEGKCSVAARYEMEQLLQDCRDKKGRYKKASELCQQQLDNRPVNKEPFFRQFVKQFLDKIHKNTEGTVHYRMDLKLSPDDVSILEKFANSELGNLQDSHHVLSDMIIGMEAVGPYVPPTWHGTIKAFLEENMQMMLLVSAVLTLTTLSGYVLMSFHWNLLYIATRLFFMFFLVSVFWNWWHLWKLETAAQYAAMLKAAPLDCKPSHELTLWEAMTQAFKLKMNECSKYHQEVMTDPLLAVPPTKALAVTITKFLVEPLEHIGRAIGRTLQATLEELPIHLWPFVLGVLLMVIVLLAFRISGLRLRVFPFLTIEPAHHPQAPALAPAKAAQPAVAPAAQPAAVEAAAPAAIRGPVEDVPKLPQAQAKGGQNVLHVLPPVDDLGPGGPLDEADGVGSRPTADAGVAGVGLTAGASGEGVRSRPTAGAGGEGVRSRPTAGAGGEGVRSRPIAGAGGEGVRSRPFAGADREQVVCSRPTASAAPTSSANAEESTGRQPTATAGVVCDSQATATAIADAGSGDHDASRSSKDHPGRRPTSGTSEGSSKHTRPTSGSNSQPKSSAEPQAAERSGSGDGAQVQNSATPKQLQRPSIQTTPVPEPTCEATLGLPTPETEDPGEGDLYDPHTHQRESATVTYRRGEPQTGSRLTLVGEESNTSSGDNNRESATTELEQGQATGNLAGGTANMVADTLGGVQVMDEPVTAEDGESGSHSTGGDSAGNSDISGYVMVESDASEESTNEELSSAEPPSQSVYDI